MVTFLIVAAATQMFWPDRRSPEVHATASWASKKL